MDDNEKFWLGIQTTENEAVINRMQGCDGTWYEGTDGTRLDPDYSDWSVRIHDKHFHSLSFLHRTIAILPKSRLETIYKLIGEYLGKT